MKSRFSITGIKRVAGSAGETTPAALGWLFFFLLFVYVALQLESTAWGKGSQAKKTARQASAPPGLCYAFSRASNLGTVCQGKREQIPFNAEVLDFAVLADGSTLAVQKISRPSTGALAMRSSLNVFALNDKQAVTTVEVEGRGHLHGTCGTILFFDVANEHPVDVLTSKPLQFPPYQYFRCSSDRRSIAGFTEQDLTESRERASTDINKVDLLTLRVGRSGETTVAAIPGDLHTFDVSPNGDFISYFALLPGKPGPDLCVTRLSGTRSCVYQGGEQTSVADNGDVLYWYASDRARGIGYWRLGSTRTVVLEKGASNPQWITPDAASALHEWNLRRQQKRSP